MIRQSVEDLKSSMYPNPAPQKVLVWHLWWQTIGKNQTKREKNKRNDYQKKNGILYNIRI